MEIKHTYKIYRFKVEVENNGIKSERIVASNLMSAINEFLSYYPNGEECLTDVSVENEVLSVALELRDTDIASEMIPQTNHTHEEDTQGILSLLQ